eukprot:936474-Pleurochrysis_carterae.AAC.3
MACGRRERALRRPGTRSARGLSKRGVPIQSNRHRRPPRPRSRGLFSLIWKGSSCPYRHQVCSDLTVSLAKSRYALVRATIAHAAARTDALTSSSHSNRAS